MESSIKVTKDEFARVMRRAGYSPEVISELADQLSDPVDIDRDEAVIARYGVTRGRLMELLGSSP